MFWITEDSILDDGGNLLVTSYVDLRAEGERDVIQSLVKGCKREHALEDGETVLISKPERFREYGAALIRDEQEGLAKVDRVLPERETPEAAVRRRVVAEQNEALEILGLPDQKSEYQEAEKTNSEFLSYGKDWWIFCASIRPDDDDWDAWRATLDDDYNHVSEIGQPAKFAQALARMVAEQIGPHGKGEQVNGKLGTKTDLKFQWVIHGPVVYTDSLLESLVKEEDEVRKLAACLFMKPISHAAQREYRFVVMNGGAPEPTVLLKISETMRDALRPQAVNLVKEGGVPSSRSAIGLERQAPKQTPVRAIVKERRTLKERRLETRDSEGQVIHSDVERRESVEKRDRNGEWGEPDTSVTYRNSGLRFHTPDNFLNEMLHKAWKDPTSSMGGMPQDMSAYSSEEVGKLFGVTATLAHKIPLVATEYRQEAASACWHAFRCIHKIYYQLGDIVNTVRIERDRFVVIKIKESERKVACSIVICPVGAYVYRLSHPNKSWSTAVTAKGELIDGGLMEWRVSPFSPGLGFLATFGGWPSKSN